MPRERTFFVLFVLLVAAGAVIGQLRGGTEVERSALAAAAAPAPQDTDRRRWQPLAYTALERPAIQELIVATGARIARGGEVFVLDWGDAAVKRFDAAGTLLTTYRWTPRRDGGFAPPPNDFAVDAAGRVWAAFSEQRLLKVFAPGGPEEKLVDLDRQPHRLVLAPDGGFVVLGLDAGEHLFARYDAEGALVRTFGALLAGAVQDPALIDGSLAADDAGGFVYAPLYLGLLASFTVDGEPRFVVETVGGGADVPEVLAHADGSRRLVPGTARTSLTVHVREGRIHVLSERATASEKTRIIDVYSNADGAYLKSIRLPTGPRDALLDGETLVTVHRSRLRHWRAVPASPERPAV